MNSFLGTSGLTYLWGKIKDAVSVKADKIQEVNHGTSDTTFTLTPNVMHIWGTVTSLNLSLPTDTNTLLDEFLFTFTSGSTPTTLTLPATIKWIQDPEFEENKTYQVSIVNNLAGYLTNGMVAGSSGGGGGENNVIESISVNGVAQTVSSKNVDLLFKTINNTPIEGSGNITIQGGGGNTNVIETVKVNGTALTPDANKAVDVIVPTKVSDLNNDSGFLTGETDPTVPSWAKQSTKPSYTASEVGALPSSTTIPSALSQLSDDSTHRTVTDTEKSTWNSKGTYSKPSGGIPASDIASGVIPTVPTNVSAFTNDANYVSSNNTVAIYSGSSAPSSSTGKNGDIYIQTS